MAPMESLPGRASITDVAVKLGRFSHPIEFGTPEMYSLKGFRIEPFVFKDANSEKTDGCKFVIEPGGSTHVVQLLSKKSQYEIPVSGSGFLLRYTRDGVVETYAFSDERIHTASYQMDHSDTNAYVWIADIHAKSDEPFEVVSLSTPKYEPSDEKVLKTFMDMFELPLTFWREYNSLKHEGKTVIGTTPLPI